MDNLVYLLNVRMSGIKSIKNEIRLDFYKKTVDKNFDPDKFRFKAIYGKMVRERQQLLLESRYFRI